MDHDDKIARAEMAYIAEYCGLALDHLHVRDREAFFAGSNACLRPALRAAVNAAGSGWQPIETAPKGGGQRFLAANLYGSVAVCMWAPGQDHPQVMWDGSPMYDAIVWAPLYEPSPETLADAEAAMDDAETVSHCGGCGKPLKDGEIAFAYLDNDPVVCGACAPSPDEQERGRSDCKASYGDGCGHDHCGSFVRCWATA